MPVTNTLNQFRVIRAKLESHTFTEGLVEAGNDIVKLASELAPKDTGQLSQSGDVRIINPNTVEVSFGNGLPDDRAPAQEYGTMFSPAQPFLGPAVKDTDILFHVRKSLALE